MSLDNICVWKQVVEHDKDKHEYKTFPIPNKCYECSGQDNDCMTYVLAQERKKPKFHIHKGGKAYQDGSD